MKQIVDALVRSLSLSSLSLFGRDYGLRDGILTVDLSGSWSISADFERTVQLPEIFAGDSVSCSLTTKDGLIVSGLASFSQLSDRDVKLRGISALVGLDFVEDSEGGSPDGH
jgi:hypothetical protein